MRATNERIAAAEAVRKDCPIDMAWASCCVGKIVDERSIVANEYVLDLHKALDNAMKFT